MKQRLLFSIFACLMAGSLIAQSGSITNVEAAQRSDGSGLVDVYFDLNAPGGFYFLNLRVSFDTGQNYYPVSPNTFIADEYPLQPGNVRHIVWDPSVDHPNRFSPQTKLRIVAYSADNTNACPGTPTVMDVDGNVYNTVQVGNQCWMASNLNTTKKPNGGALSRYCYNNDPENCELYGGLYTWSTMMNGAGSSGNNPSGVQGICPTGWHVPSDAEWTQLTSYLINTYIDITTGNVGNKLKSCRQVSSPLGGECSTSDHPRWNSNATHYGTNDFGFASLPGGSCGGGSFYGLGSYGYWWSSTEDSSLAWYRLMFYNNGGVYRNGDNQSDGFSVRCVRD